MPTTYLNTRFADNFGSFNDPGLPALQNIVAGRGISNGNAWTCSRNYLLQQVPAAGSFSTVLTQLRLQMMVQYYKGGFDPIWPVPLFQFNEQIDRNSVYGFSFNAFFVLNANGSVTVSILKGTPPFGSPQTYTSTTPANTIVYDGTTHAVQAALIFTSNSSVNLQFKVNSTLLINDTINSVQVGFWSQDVSNPVAGVNLVTFFATSQVFSGGAFQSSVGEVIITDDSTVGTYPIAFMPQLNSAFCASPIILTANGIYQLVPNFRHDTLYVNASLGTTAVFKIPNPFAITYLAGDE